jgi:hypothetical protein
VKVDKELDLRVENLGKNILKKQRNLKKVEERRIITCLVKKKKRQFNFATKAVVLVRMFTNETAQQVVSYLSRDGKQISLEK